jgi:lipid-A-disaccharide synthase
LKNQPIVALLPGSRTAEITEMLPVMLETALNFPEFQFVIAGAPSQHISLYLETAKNQNISIVFGKTYELLKHSTAALVTSGTATLETALFDVPQVVCYKGNPISYHIAKRLILVKYISLVNLVLDREVVTELIQSDLNVAKTSEELKKLAYPGENRTQLLKDYSELKKELGHSGASQRTAKIMLNFLRDLRLHT